MDPVPAVQEVGPPLLETAAPLPSAQVISAFLNLRGKKKKKEWASVKCDSEPKNGLCLINF